MVGAALACRFVGIWLRCKRGCYSARAALISSAANFLLLLFLFDCVAKEKEFMALWARIIHSAYVWCCCLCWRFVTSTAFRSAG